MQTFAVTRRLLAPALALVIAIMAFSSVSAAGVTGPAFYIDGILYRTVGTPTDFSSTGAPAHTYDVIYNFGGLQLNVATAAPGDPGFNGGRWEVHRLVFGANQYQAALADALVDLNHNDVLDSDEEVLAAIARGYASDGGVIRRFECTVVPLPRSR